MTATRDELARLALAGDRLACAAIVKRVWLMGWEEAIRACAELADEAPDLPLPEFIAAIREAEATGDETQRERSPL